MANDWIKMRIDLQSHPKIVRILSATSTDKFRVVGGLHAVWGVFDTHSEDGKLAGYTPELLDHVIGWPGLARAMESVGWLAYDGLETLTLPEFSEHNGQSAKRRGEDQKRKRDGRKTCPQPVRKKSDDLRTREEKRREENKEIQEEVLPDWLPPEKWQDFVDHRKAIKATMTEKARERMLRHLVDLKAKGHDALALMDAAIRSGWKDVYEPKPAGQFNSPAMPAVNKPGGGRRAL